MSEAQNLFVGNKAVKNFVEHENIDLVGVLYEDETNEDFTREQWAEVKSETAYPAQLVMKRKFAPAMREVIAILLKNRARISDFRTILEMTDETVGANYRKTIEQMYNVKDTGEIMLSDVHEKLLGQSK